MGTILHTVWGLLLGSYSNGRDVVFGKVVSGRNARIPGIDSMIGLFANTVPVRVRTEPRQSLLELLKEQQRKAVEAEGYSYCSLAEIQQNVGSEALIGTLFAFENYSISPEYREKYSTLVTVEHSREQTNFDLTISVSEEDTGLYTEFLYDPKVYYQRNVERIASHYESLLQQLAEAPQRSVCELFCGTKEERGQLLGLFNSTHHLKDTDHSIMELFLQRVQEQPRSIAVVFGEEKLSYRELNEKGYICPGLGDCGDRIFGTK
jgi:non-ribosomal peptide synthetase component F